MTPPKPAQALKHLELIIKRCSGYFIGSAELEEVGKGMTEIRVALDRLSQLESLIAPLIEALESCGVYTSGITHYDPAKVSKALSGLRALSANTAAKLGEVV